ncbi:MAG: GDP-mannose 4,6-dehydratase [Candidatus Hydrogenedentes bacterium]|nr:GDP-mannose 4,6-dehydratase [Candidatus Hydrogenedentota bacterium]
MRGSALVTGGNGFVGRHLVNYLKGNGWNVYACDLTPGEGINICDITNENDLEKILEIIDSFTHIFYLSAVTFVPDSIQNPGECFRVNTLAAIKWIERLLTKNEAPIFVYISTSEVYGSPNYLPVDENHPLNPHNPYSISKSATDLYCQFVHKQFGFPAVIVRPFNHSGPGQNERFVLSSFAKQFAEMSLGFRDRVLSVGNLDVERDFLHVLDVVKAYELIALKCFPGEVYNLCCGRAVSLRYAIDVLKSISGIEPDIVIDPSKIRRVDVNCIYGTHEKLSSHVGWYPTFTVEDILRDLYGYWLKALCDCAF